jgi:hypothetical protein
LAEKSSSEPCRRRNSPASRSAFSRAAALFGMSVVRK